MVQRIARMALASVLLLVVSAAASAQAWTLEQQKVWALEQQQWQMAKAKDSTWIEKMVHPNLRYWETGQPMPQDRASLSRWNRYTSANRCRRIVAVASK